MYDLRFCVAESVTSNITITPSIYINIDVCMLSGKAQKIPLNRKGWPAESGRQTYFNFFLPFNFKEHRQISQYWGKYPDKK